jgi:hypothetical protein
MLEPSHVHHASLRLAMLCENGAALVSSGVLCFLFSSNAQDKSAASLAGSDEEDLDDGDDGVDMARQPWTAEEDLAICKAQKRMGNRWTAGERASTRQPCAARPTSAARRECYSMLGGINTLR